MNHLAQLRQQRGLTIEATSKLLLIRPETFQRYEYGDFDHVPEIEAEFERRLMALGWLDCTESTAAA
jgi:hypothetical protein